jgi:hypothetical protein
VQWTDELREHFIQRADEGLVEIARAHSLAKLLAPDLIRATSLPPVVRLGCLPTMMPRTVVTPKGEIHCEEDERQPSCFAEFIMPPPDSPRRARSSISMCK